MGKVTVVSEGVTCTSECGADGELISMSATTLQTGRPTHRGDWRVSLGASRGFCGSIEVVLMRVACVANKPAALCH